MAWRAGFSVAAAALVVLLMSLLLGMKRQVPLIAGVITAYRAPLGPMAMAEEDRALLAGLSRGRRVFDPGTAKLIDISASIREADATQFADECAGQLGRIRGGGPGGDTAIVYITAIGAVDREGHACLVPSKPSSESFADADERWLRVDDLLDKLEAARPRETHVLVVLDACRPSYGQPFGILDGAFAAALAADVQAASRERMWVLSSAGPGETACAEATDGASVFAAAFTEGLEGLADSQPWGNGDGRIGLRELAAYLGDEVDRRCVFYHGRRQRPFVIPTPSDTGRDVGIAWKVRGESQTISVDRRIATVAGHSDWLRARWSAAERLRKRGVHERPLQWAEYEHLLLRAERLGRSGAAGRSELHEVKIAAETVEKLLGEPLFTAAPLPGFRLTQLARDSRVPAEPVWLRRLDAWGESVAGTATADVSAEPAKPCRDPEQWLVRASEAWSRFVSLARAGAVLDRAAWDSWVNLIGPLPSGSPLLPSEWQTAVLLHRWADLETWKSSPGVITRVALLSQDAMEAALPDDVRADRLVESIMPRRNADGARRMAFDLLIPGDETSISRSSELARTATASYGETAAVGRTVSAAWQLLDTARAELPWLAIWHANTQATRHDQATGGRAASDRVVSATAEMVWNKLANALSRLEKLLESDTVASSGKAVSETIRITSAEVEQQFEILRGAYDEACDGLAERAAANATTLAAIRRVLDIPLVDGTRRLRLLDRAEDLAASLAARQVPATQETPRPTVPEPTLATHGWVPWAGLVVEPLVVATAVEAARPVRQPTSAAEVAVAVGSWGQAIRTAAAALLRQAGDTVHVGAAATSIAAARSAAQTAGSAAASRRLAPVFVCVCGESETLHGDLSPVANQLHRLWHDRLVTMAVDAMNDFYAGVDRDEPAWFAAAATACLDQAAALATTGNGLEQASTRLAALKQTVPKWAVINNAPDRLGTAEEQSTALVRSQLVIDGRVAEWIMPGEASLWLADGTTDDVIWLRTAAHANAARRVVLPAGRPDARGSPRGAEWRVDRTSAAHVAARQGSAIDLVAWFRGHQIVQELSVVAAGGLQPIVWRHPAPLPPRITVRGSQHRHGFVSFIFDCSGSMGKDTPDGRQRFDVGRESLYEVLRAMATAGNWDASVWLYGHRTKWTKAVSGKYDAGLSEAGMRERDVATQAGRTFDLQPGMDVQRVLPMQPLGPGQAREVEQLLNQLKPAGETPLYLALRNALADDLAAVGGGDAWRVIVVTDGVNDQTGVQPLTTASDVRDMLAAVNRGRAQPVRLDVIAFDLRGSGQSKNELQSLAKGSGGEFHEAADPKSLLKVLRDFLQLARWEVRNDRGFTISAELGSSVELPILQTANPCQYDVMLDGKKETTTSVFASGGEGIELYLTANGDGFEHRRYDGGTEQGIRDKQTGLPDPSDPSSRWFVAAHLPKREGDKVRFPISLQNDDETGFSPRPVELWAELLAGGIAGSRPFVFFDPEYEPHRPVPVVDLVAPDWPRDADQAIIRVWFTTSPLEPAASILIDELPVGEGKQFSFPKLPGMSLDVLFEKQSQDRGRLTVVERHSPEAAADLPRLLARMESGCNRALHAVDIDTATVRHEFEVLLDKGRVGPGTRLTFVDRDRLKEQAVGPATPGGAVKPLRVSLPRD